LTDVESSNQHTVKPWFDGRLDFIPPVSDYSGQGFPLVGGRLDVLDGRRVAAVVYSRGKHLISLFAWPARGAEPISDRAGSREGYNWIIWGSRDMQFCLVSDVSARDLRELRDLMSR
jgi:anti-sigma factor RsiW